MSFSAECTVRLLNQAGRNNYPYNPKYVENTGDQTRDIWLVKCISNQQLYHLSSSTTSYHAKNRYFVSENFILHINFIILNFILPI